MSPVGPGIVMLTGYTWNVFVTLIVANTWLTRVALAGLPSPSVSLYTSSRAVLPTNDGSFAPCDGQKTLMELRFTGYAPTGGVKRLSQMAAVSVVVVPKPMLFSAEPSSTWNVIGAVS